MANTFKNSSAALLTSSTDVYTAPTGGSAVIFALYFSNVTGTTASDVTIEVYDYSTAQTKTIGKNLPIPGGSTLNFGKVSLESQDVLRAFSSTGGTIEGFASVLEIT